jgi:hypothetical protein
VAALRRVENSDWHSTWRITQEQQALRAFASAGRDERSVDNGDGGQRETLVAGFPTTH